ncbi:MAG TPA: APC family permease [Methylomirabilota bacterium]|jgi:amino acid transporter|nr:APC family permease [Methylomirabilota bacterium]
MSVQRLKRVLVGRPIPTSLDQHERLSRVTGLAVFASDALSSVAYATEAILLVLVAAGTAALGASLPIAIAIAVLVGIVVTSFRQSILAYPKGGGAYVVTRENLGRYPSLVAGAALLIDYVLTVAVSTAAGIDAITSAIPELFSHRVVLCVAGVIAIAVANLRGVREAGRLFAGPTYLFVGAYLLMIGWGLVQWLGGAVGPPVLESGAPPRGVEALTLFLALRAFASGCAALTGIEAVSDGVPAFRTPEAQNARQVLAVLGLILIVLFVGITFLVYVFHVVPVAGETTNSQLARLVFGQSPLYFLVQAVTALILVLAANTSFADFPRVASFLARDGFVPRQFGNRGDRLAYSNGILILTALSVILLVVFHGDTHALIPLYAVGVFLSFTLKQASMIRYWLRRRQAGWVSGVAVQSVGAAATGLVMVIIAVTKFTHGAWIVVVLIPTLVVAFVTVRRHYDQVARQLSIEGAEVEPPLTSHIVLVLVGDVHRGVLRAIRYARALSEDARGVYIEITPEQTRRVEERWGRFGGGMPLVVLRSPYRSVAGPLLEYLDHLQRQATDQLVTIILPEFIPARWWQHLLHNQTALLIKGALLFRKGVIVTNVPYHLEQ